MMYPPLSLILCTVLLYAVFWFLLSLILKRNDIADIAWGLEFVTLSVVSVAYTGQYTWRAAIIFLLICIWAIRLSFHIAKRNAFKHEDYRYAQWRKDWGNWFYLRSFVQVYLLQGVLAVFIAIPAIVILSSNISSFGVFDVLGIIVWIIGFVFESLGDYQLAQFIKVPENKGKIMQSGLWKYTRHPNYFGEVTMWWGIWQISLSVPFGWISIIGPVLITFLIVFVSGIPLLESKYQGNVHYDKYKRNTSVFFPLPAGNLP